MNHSRTAGGRITTRSNGTRTLYLLNLGRYIINIPRVIFDDVIIIQTAAAAADSNIGANSSFFFFFLSATKRIRARTETPEYITRA